ncbi:Hydroxypyruvate isomerase [Ancylobacter novellus DSM 506]|uniref:Hydroxypyruvate isomerase n=1 Tax=Ancylobacter novellus (strain ATCC 8093 / DSM 506 / JCM 20403 / CCM 1077 / IAM 12100 / NBRC 12443 / NCIMB 10456) TaxID=639283 RepID=D6ZZ89_ANCN5|nr:TIM barrel protein [Ancylobacter novellus]ADH89225.1 Hydroxypyruvate isomerase [Ancylobacter novellus DSM 506]
MKGFSAHIGYLFNEVPLERRFAAARDAGFSMVEHPTLYSLPAARVRQLLAECGLGLVQSSFPAGDIARGEKGFAALPNEIERFRASLAGSVDYAVEAGIPALHCMAGVRPAGADPRQMWDTYIANMRAAASATAERGILLLIEPISSGSIADYFIEDPMDAVRAIAEIGASNVRLLYDVFHATMIGSDPFGFIRDHAELIYHIHIADHPGRHEPGTGTIDFQRLYGTLEDVGYDGFIGCEYVPRGDTVEGLGWMNGFRPI